MKKTILVLAMIVAVGFTFTSCKNDKKEEVKAEEVKTEESKELASNEVYQCPMDCEQGKSYTEAGSCPVCKMDLKAKKAGETANVCKCKEGEKCTCAEGECKCSDKADAKICTKCGKDKAECTCDENKSEKDSTNHDGHNH